MNKLLIAIDQTEPVAATANEFLGANSNPVASFWLHVDKCGKS